ncbi:MAG: hypothetical protein RR982_01135 [Kiritimatiellia bacterium]
MSIDRWLSSVRKRLAAGKSSRAGQALAELTIALVVLVILITGVTQVVRLCLHQQFLRREVRAESGLAALTRSTEGWADETQRAETRSDPFHRINAFAALETFHPTLTSRLPSSNYTLASRDMPEAELGIKTMTREEAMLLDPTFAALIYGREKVRLRESVTFPATTGLWE